MPNSIKICIVDDDPFMLMLLSDHLLKKPSYEVSIFSSGEACLKQVDMNPDAFIIDQQLDCEDEKAADGLTIIKQLQAMHLEALMILLTSEDLVSMKLKDQKLMDVHYIQKGSAAFAEIDKILARL